jgi:hypothetical protein
MPLSLRLAGLAFVPLAAGAFTIAFSRVLAIEFRVPVAPGLAHAAVLGSLFVVGVLSFRWSGRLAVAAGTMLASILVTGLALVALILWALSITE